MHNLTVIFPQIVAGASSIGMPAGKSRGILREYLQAKWIRDVYRQSSASQLSFVGGTSLRLLRDLPRFSEDLDFDNLGLSQTAVGRIFEKVMTGWQKEGFEIEWLEKNLGEATYYEIRLPKLLLDLGLTTDPREKLRIKLDTAGWWQGQKREVVLMNRFGFLEQVVTNSLDQILVQKLTAYVRRLQTQPRDIFDVVWLFSQGARLDRDFMMTNGLDDLLVQAQSKLATEGVPQSFKRRLQPFLFQEADVSQLRLFERVLAELT